MVQAARNAILAAGRLVKAARLSLKSGPNSSLAMRGKRPVAWGFPQHLNLSMPGGV